MSGLRLLEERHAGAISRAATILSAYAIADEDLFDEDRATDEFFAWLKEQGWDCQKDDGFMTWALKATGPEIVVEGLRRFLRQVNDLIATYPEPTNDVLLLRAVIARKERLDFEVDTRTLTASEAGPNLWRVSFSESGPHWYFAVSHKTVLRQHPSVWTMTFTTVGGWVDYGTSRTLEEAVDHAIAQHVG